MQCVRRAPSKPPDGHQSRGRLLLKDDWSAGVCQQLKQLLGEICRNLGRCFSYWAGLVFLVRRNEPTPLVSCFNEKQQGNPPLWGGGVLLKRHTRLLFFGDPTLFPALQAGCRRSPWWEPQALACRAVLARRPDRPLAKASSFRPSRLPWSRREPQVQVVVAEASAAVVGRPLAEASGHPSRLSWALASGVEILATGRSSGFGLSGRSVCHNRLCHNCLSQALSPLCLSQALSACRRVGDHPVSCQLKPYDPKPVGQGNRNWPPGIAVWWTSCKESCPLLWRFPH